MADKKLLPITSSQRDYSLDFLKAISIVFVLLWHFQPLRISWNQETRSLLGKFLSFLVSLFNLQVTLTAVPIFILVSLYIYSLKYQKNLIYTQKRIQRLTTVFFFWIIFQLALYVLMYLYIKIRGLKTAMPAINPWELISRGGPNLPGIGQSVFYFLFILISLIIIAYFYLITLDIVKIKSKEKIKNFINFLIIAIFLFYFEFCNLSNTRLPYWRIDSFMIYIPTIQLIINNPTRFYQLKFYYFLTFILFSVQDTLLVNQGYSLASYGRISIFCGAIFLFSLVRSRQWRERQYINYLAKYSLGLFAIHPYVGVFFGSLFSKLLRHQFVTIVDFQLSLAALITSFFTFIFVLISLYLLRSTPFKRFIS